MATPFDPSHANLFDIYNDAMPAPALPCGGCNFADLTPGATGLKCGCRRFWARNLLGSSVLDQAGWCMCNHHACYHDQGLQSLPLVQASERPATAREPPSPVPALTAASALPAIDATSFGDPAPLSFVHELPDCFPGAAVVNTSQPPGSLPDTLAWGDVVNTANPLPPIPSQCLIPSQTASTAPSVQARYLRPFSGKGLQTLAGAGDANSPRGQQPSDTRPTSHGQDASAVIVRPSKPSAKSGPGSSPNTQLVHRTDPDAMGDLANAVGEHARRLDRLETVSFHEECHDKMDNFDVRMSELENRVDEMERLADNASVTTARAARDDDGATQSVASASTSLTSPAQLCPDVLGQLSSLQAQVSQLQSYLPTPHRAWVVEVVFLPFPLKRLWQDIHQFRSDGPADGDEWTQLPMTLSTATRRSQSPFCNDWATPGHEAEWLLPRACGNTSVADRRLRSRGLIRTISVTGPDFRSVQAAVYAAFGGVFRELRLVPRSHPLSARFLGLQQHWVPLRKVHKDSRLRFLSPAEMTTPGLWDVPFLSSVMMRSSEPRLYITHPDAYLQDSQAFAAGPTWQRVRETTRVYPDAAESTEVPEADAPEEYWAWNEQLDEGPRPGASSSSRRDRRRVSLSPVLVRGHSVQSWRRSTSPLVARGQSPLTTRWREWAVPSLLRTASVPVGPGRPLPGAGGHRVASHGQLQRPSPTIQVASQARAVKKRRTRSPTHQRHFTPRWTASPSPMLPSFNERPQPRGATPQAYATPHSNAPLQEIRPLRGSSATRAVTMRAAEPSYVFPDMEMYSSGSDESYMEGEGDGDGDDDDDDDGDDDVDGGGGDDDDLAARRLVLDSHRGHLPEDEPWPGIEDQEGLVEDGENVDPRDQDGGRSASSSQPSEYPSTPWLAGFHIHEDE